MLVPVGLPLRENVAHGRFQNDIKDTGIENQQDNSSWDTQREGSWLGGEGARRGKHGFSSALRRHRCMVLLGGPSRSESEEDGSAFPADLLWWRISNQASVPSRLRQHWAWAPRVYLRLGDSPPPADVQISKDGFSFLRPDVQQDTVALEASKGGKKKSEFPQRKNPTTYLNLEVKPGASSQSLQELSSSKPLRSPCPFLNLSACL
ncbi:uncharacterized protein [Canis lupus baileyi]|uniref:uncharacterized protein n=1 Tax=Canis lupus baileyi TaxID=143281 RepID=UPI003B97C021